jgi:hypothetical protein
MVALFTVAYFAATSILASRKGYGFDELTTVYIAKFPTLGAVWKAWSEGPDGLPAFTHFLTHLGFSVFGFSHFAARSPEILGFWLMCVCIFIFLNRRIGPVLASLGMLLPLTAPTAYFYSFEARGYGMVLGFCGAALLCWDLAVDNRWRRLALLGVPIFLAGAIAIHPYAFLVCIPLGFAELARTWERRRVDWPVWISFTATAIPWLATYPVLAHIYQLGLGTSTSGTTLYRTGLGRLFEIWPQYLSLPATYVGLLAVVCLTNLIRPSADGTASQSSPGREARLPEWVLIIGLIALPAIGMVFASLSTGALLVRYVAATIIGFSLGIPLLCQATLKRRPEFALLCAAWVAVAAVGGVMNTRDDMLHLGDIQAGRSCFAPMRVGSQLPPDGLPVVVSDPYYYTQLAFYAPKEINQRLMYLADMSFERLAKFNAAMDFYKRVFGWRMEPFDKFIESKSSFYLYDCQENGPNTLKTRLTTRGAVLRDSGLPLTVGVFFRTDLYHVTMPGNSTPTATQQ